MNKVEKIKADIDRLQETTMDENRNFLSSYHEGIFDGLSMIENFIDSLEEEPVSNDLEEFAKMESELFGEREYEIDYIDRNALAKGYYWGVKAGAQWQKERDQSTIELAEDHAYLAGQEKIIAKAIKWLEDNIDRYLYNTGGYGEYIPKCGGKMFEDFKKAMEK